MIEEEITRAKALYSSDGENLKRENQLAESIRKYKLALSKTYAQMARGGVAEACSICATKEEGGCCFEGVEEWYDTISLLINLLMGAGLPRTREVPGGCLFVGRKGCKLVARHAFCVNYLCPHLLAFMGESERAKLLSISGEELLCGWEMEKSVRRWLMDHPPQSSLSLEESERMR